MPPTAGMKCTGMYAIYDEVNQGVKLIDDNEYAEVKDIYLYIVCLIYKLRKARQNKSRPRSNQHHLLSKFSL
jgi:hypothetical protein